MEEYNIAGTSCRDPIILMSHEMKINQMHGSTAGHLVKNHILDRIDQKRYYASYIQYVGILYGVCFQFYRQFGNKHFMRFGSIHTVINARLPKVFKCYSLMFDLRPSIVSNQMLIKGKAPVLCYLSDFLQHQQVCVLLNVIATETRSVVWRFYTTLNMVGGLTGSRPTAEQTLLPRFVRQALVYQNKHGFALQIRIFIYCL